MAGSTLIEGGTVVTVDPTNSVYPDGGVLVDGHDIVAVGDAEELRAANRIDRTVDASGCAVLPGLVNLHLHSGFIRGLAEDMPVFEWLAEHVDPTHEALTREEARVAYELCYAEMARAGITTALDMYRYMHEAADIASEYGLRVTLAPYVADEYDYFESLEDNRRLVKRRHGDANGRVRVWFGLEHLTYCTEEAYHRVAEYATEYGVGIHTHGEESKEMHADLTDGGFRLHNPLWAEMAAGEIPDGRGTDRHALLEGRVSVSPLSLRSADDAGFEELEPLFDAVTD